MSGASRWTRPATSTPPTSLNQQIVVFPNAMNAPPQSASSAPAAPASSTASSGPSSYPSAQLCLLTYGLPGTLDYPWSAAITATVSYNPTPVTTPFGRAVALVSGSGSRTYTNRFGTITTVPFTLQVQSGSPTYLYLNTSTPVDQTGLTLTLGSAIALPGVTPKLMQTSLRVFTQAGEVVEAFGAVTELRVDAQSQAYLSTVPGFVNTTVPSSNVNALAVNIAACQAPITFTNGLRTPTQPGVSNSATASSLYYRITDGATYIVTANLTIVGATLFATSRDTLGNPYQSIIYITGTRTYTYLPTASSLTSNVSFNASINANVSLVGDQRVFPTASSPRPLASILSTPIRSSMRLACSSSSARPSLRWGSR